MKTLKIVGIVFLSFTSFGSISIAVDDFSFEKEELKQWDYELADKKSDAEIEQLKKNFGKYKDFLLKTAAKDYAEVFANNDPGIMKRVKEIEKMGSIALDCSFAENDAEVILKKREFIRIIGQIELTKFERKEDIEKMTDVDEIGKEVGLLPLTELEYRKKLIKAYLEQINEHIAKMIAFHEANIIIYQESEMEEMVELSDICTFADNRLSFVLEAKKIFLQKKEADRLAGGKVF
ncbi:MAG: hypothetical protein L6Q29_00375 [Candidatus Pacebacteria bacterium]|nr:hypothetical protein [Candidatus Paceibacterota bacterium]